MSKYGTLAIGIVLAGCYLYFPDARTLIVTVTVAATFLAIAAGVELSQRLYKLEAAAEEQSRD